MPGWNMGVLATFLYALVNVLVWYGILRAWRRVGFVGSFEWLTGYALRATARKDTSKLRAATGGL